jgi:hypothetical protein
MFETSAKDNLNVEDVSVLSDWENDVNYFHRM